MKYRGGFGQARNRPGRPWRSPFRCRSPWPPAASIPSGVAAPCAAGARERWNSKYHRIVARQTVYRESAKRQRPGQSSGSSSFVLVLIGIFKLLKALLLIAVGIGAIKFLHKGVAGTVTHWIQVLRVDPDNRFLHGMLVRIFRVTPKQLKELSVGTFIYAGLFATEGVGLLLRKRWAEYFTIVTTSGLIPLEIFELARHFTVTKLVVALINVLIVWYLVARVRSH
jgi:uncharacterized membrane protein (DUF2068 family)